MIDRLNLKIEGRFLDFSRRGQRLGSIVIDLIVSSSLKSNEFLIIINLIPNPEIKYKKTVELVENALTKIGDAIPRSSQRYSYLYPRRTNRPLCKWY